MLEALVAVSLTGNVVQFVQLAGELISQAAAIRREGGPSSLPALKGLTEHLDIQAGIIKTQLDQSTVDQTISQEDQHLLAVATDCQDEGKKFSDYLNTLPVPDQGASSSVRKSIQMSIKLKWVHRRVEDYAQKLDRYRSALTLATILALRARTNEHDTNILNNLKELTQASSSHADGLRSLQTLLGTEGSVSGLKLRAIQDRVERCLDQIEQLRQEQPQSQERAILRWLNFRQMSWRYEEVIPAFRNTFQWIFQPPSDSTPWDSFDAYLRNQNISLPYWINGKAGSGKSTLIKFIVNEPRTHEALTSWAGSRELLIVNFFFWNLGTLLQKSNTGLLRALIHSVLDTHPELIPAVFPSIYQNWKMSDADYSPSYIEVKKAFELLIRKSAQFLRLCVVVDGIDEFEGDYKDMSLFLRSVASPQVKVIVSSRPLNACISVFKDCSKLMLQDLTKGDMEVFVRENLCSHSSMVDLTRRFPRQANELVEEIRSKATGVFLWVKIVVRLLIDGLESGDNMNDLQNKLRLLPPDLRDLYRRMFERMEPGHRRQAAEIFRLFHTWNMEISTDSLQTAILAFALQTQPEAEAFGDVAMTLNQEELDRQCKNIEARLRSRCCGLLEVHNTKSGLVNSHIEYLHRTVAEFLQADDVWSEICDLTSTFEFDPAIKLAVASLKTVEVQPCESLGSLVQSIERIMALCRAAVHAPTEIVVAVVNEFDRMMSQHQQKLNNGKNFNYLPYRDMYWAAEFLELDLVPLSNRATLLQCADIFSVAARYAVHQYLKSAGSYRSLSDLSKYALVVQALQGWRMNLVLRPSLHDRSETLHFLLSTVTNPDAEVFGRYLLTCATAVGSSLLEKKPVDCAELLRVLLVTTQNRRSLVMLPALTSWSVIPAATDLKHLLVQLKCYTWNGAEKAPVEPAEVRQLGEQLEELVLSDEACPHISNDFLEAVSVESSLRPSLGSYRSIEPPPSSASKLRLNNKSDPSRHDTHSRSFLNNKDAYLETLPILDLQQRLNSAWQFPNSGHCSPPVKHATGFNGGNNHYFRLPRHHRHSSPYLQQPMNDGQGFDGGHIYDCHRPDNGLVHNFHFTLTPRPTTFHPRPELVDCSSSSPVNSNSNNHYNQRLAICDSSLVYINERNAMQQWMQPAHFPAPHQPAYHGRIPYYPPDKRSIHQLEAYGQPVPGGAEIDSQMAAVYPGVTSPPNSRYPWYQPSRTSKAAQ